MTISTERKQYPLLNVKPHAPAVVGWGAHKMAGKECQERGIKHALLVTTGLKGTGIVDEVEGVLKANSITVTRFENVTSSPKDYEVREGVQVYLDAGCNGIVSVGGGSSHDAGKVIRLMATNDGAKTDLRKFAAFNDPHFTTLLHTYKVITIPQVAINTTTGTGANCTNNAVITDVDWKYKMLLIVPGIQPSYGIDDPAFMRLQPAHVVARSAMDAFCHAMEPFIGRYNFPICHATGHRAIKLLSENLRQAYANPANDVAIENLAWAQFIASMSFNMGGGMGMVHLLGHMVAVLKDLHHGHANAIMMMPVERFNVVACPERFKELGEAMGLDIRHMNPVQGADRTLEAIERLRNEVGIRQIPLKELDFTEKDVEHSVKWAMKDISGEANPRDFTEEELKMILRSCI